MWFTHNPYFPLVKTIFGMVVTDVWKAYCCSLSNRSKDKTLDIRVYANLLAKGLLNNLDSNLSPGGVSKNLPFCRQLPGGYEDACLLETSLLKGGGRSRTLYCPGVPHMEMVDIARASTDVLSMTYDDL